MPARHLHRRTFLRAAGVSIALPMLDAMAPRAFAAAAPPRRMVVVSPTMSVVPWWFFPAKGEGRNYEPSPYLDLIGHREDLTVCSGLSHPEVDGGHHAEISFLTAAPHPGASGFRNTISLDQYAAERIGHHTREPALVLHAGPEGGKNGLSWTASGVNLPAEDKPSELYKRLFLSGRKEEVDAQVARLREGRSALDAVLARAKGLERDLGAGDRHKLDEYFTGVRELEKRMVAAEQWARTPKPKVDEPMPKDVKDKRDIVGKARLMYRMTQLALQTDSSRIITLRVHSYGDVAVEGVDQGHHPLTHHGKRPDALKQLRLIEEARLREFRDFLASLKKTEEGGASLLDHTMVLFGSHMGDANRHSNDNLPVLLAGGGFRHGKHLAFDTKHNRPLADLYVSMLQRMGLETDRFASGTSTLTGLEPA